MKLTIVLLTTALLQVQAAGLAQSVTLSGNNISLQEVFTAVKQQTGYVVFGKKELFREARAVSVSVVKMPLTDLLDLVMKDQPLNYTIDARTIILSRKMPEPIMAGKTTDFLRLFADIPVRGRILDENGDPVMATILIKGTTRGTTSNEQGYFSLENVPENAVLIISATSIVLQEVKVNGRVNHTITASLRIVEEKAVVVNKGYYSESQRLSTGSVTRVDSRTIEKQPVTNVLQALQGRMTGLSLVQANGFPGSSFNVQVRGVNSLLNNSQPFYIVDGVPFLSDAINAQTGTAIYGANGLTSPLNSISPSDIESIEVLKDGDATAIYGSRGANGVILITTKKGRAGKTRLDMNISTGMSHVAKLLPTLKTAEFLELRKLGFKNAGQTATVSNAPDLLSWDPNAYTDYQELLIGNTANATDASIALSGGDSRTNFLVSGSYHHETTVYKLDKSYRRGSVNISVNHRSLDQKFNIALTAMYSADNNRLAVEDLTSRAYQIAPNFPLYNADGSLYWNSLVQNPLAIMMRTNRNKTSNLNSSLNLRYRPIAGLELKALVGFGRSDMDQLQLTPLATQDPSLSYSTSRANFAYNYNNNYIIEPQASYTTDLGPGKLSALVGGSWQYRMARQPYFTTASDFTSDAFMENIGSAQTVSTRSSSTDYKFASVFGRLNYVYKDRYVLNGVFRRDGSSRFGPNKRFGNFGSLGAAWIFSDESFFAPLTAWFSSGKLRGSYGITGSDNIGNYGYLDSYGSTSYSFNGSSGLVPSRIANGDYQWEQTEKLEAALELGFLKDRIKVSGSYYRNRTDNQLISYTISSQAGFSSYQANLPARVQNSGWEFTLNSTNISSRNFTWTSYFNVSANRNKLESFPDIEKSSYYTRFIVGLPISGAWVYKYSGYDETTGLPTVEDLDKNGTISSGLYEIGRGDRYYYGPNFPKFFGGLGNTFTYKNISLDFLFQFVKQNGSHIMTANTYAPGYIYNLSEDALEKYLSDGPADQRHVRSNYNVAIGNYYGSDAARVDASFIRLKNVAISYELLPGTARKLKMSAVRVFLQGQNLFTITSYDGYDPESQGLGLPPLRTVSAGLKLSF
ncbi:MAG: SusC/RagA family TonB-linked outer membrane protein [Candidatus Pseudobacter hemicellulosilyticus]|uniref:SusC/RagA family TonB-linked outer membrane protein n=1 Tax=Candidatus Pseudobacter hemicellulosilyticus TaxID=3121375 RepID=A0AAJ5WX92_9BACT|nr:MAG: SusC/RagA family TonB-linked outer membrane protein [Pseudobacter sp.]